MELDKLCKDNSICCDDNCKRCANLIYQSYLKQQEEIKGLKERLTLAENCIKGIDEAHIDDIDIILHKYQDTIKEMEKIL